MLSGRERKQQGITSTGIVVTITIALVLVALLPLLWAASLKVDLVRFTEEWYKTCADIGKILLGFCLIQVFWESSKESQIARRHRVERNDLCIEWRAMCAHASYQFNQLLVANWCGEWNDREAPIDQLEAVVRRFHYWRDHVPVEISEAANVLGQFILV